MNSRETVYLVPGLLCDETVWAAQIERLSDTFDVRVANTRGCSSITEMAKRVLDEAPPRFNLAGHSMGARVALEIYRNAPERVKRIAIMDTGVHPRNDNEVAGRMRFVNIAQEQGMAALARAWALPMVGERCQRNETFMASIYTMVEGYTLADYQGQIKALLDRPDAESVVRNVACPALVLVGADDAWSPPAQHQPIVDAIADALYVIVDDAGHMAPMEQPEAVTDAMLEWLQMG